MQSRKQLITKKLSAFIIVAMMFSVKVNAQIVYTDVNPDEKISISLNNSKDSIDINQDGVYDVLLKTTYSPPVPYVGYFYASSITPLGNNEIIKFSTGFLDTLNTETAIDSESMWNDSTLNLSKIKYTWHYHYYCKTCYNYYYTSSISGTWNDTINNHYAGVKIKTATQVYYGWIKMTATPYIITVKDFAYNSIPNQPILAGETSCASPTVTLSTSGPLSFCAGDSVTLTATGTGYQYQWKKGGVNISGAKSQTYIAKTGGVYKCKVTNSCGSKLSAGKTVTVPCRMTDENFVESLEHLSIYPNPATNSVTIKFPSDEEGEISIVNLFGEIIFSEKINSEEEQIDVSKFSAGMYVVRWSSGENNETKKFSVIK